MTIQRIPISKLIDGKGNVIIDSLNDVVINTEELTIIKRLIVKNSGRIFVDGNKLLHIYNKEDTSPLHFYNNNNLYVEKLSVTNARPTVTINATCPTSMLELTVTGGSTGVYLNHESCVVGRCILKDQQGDGVFIAASDTAVYQNKITLLGNLVEQGIHPDCIQISGRKNVEETLYKILISDNILGSYAKNNCQGIVHSEGILIDSEIHNNNIQVVNDNGIRLNRANSVRITHNTCNTNIIIGSTKISDYESNSNIVEENFCKDLVTYNIGDSIVRENEIRGNRINFDASGARVQYDKNT